jgi:hypothetical protein
MPVVLGLGGFPLLDGLQSGDEPGGDRRGDHSQHGDAGQHDGSSDQPAFGGDGVSIAITDRCQGGQGPPHGVAERTDVPVGGVSFRIQHADRPDEHDDDCGRGDLDRGTDVEVRSSAPGGVHGDGAGAGEANQSRESSYPQYPQHRYDDDIRTEVCAAIDARSSRPGLTVLACGKA